MSSGVCIIILFIAVRLSHQTNYTCDPNASCGCSMNSAVVNRIVNGEDAGESTWSWAVSIKIRVNDEETGLCGGSILSESWILTAAHCLYGIRSEQVMVYAGSNLQFEGVESMEASDLILHPNYDNNTLENDIALIQLLSPFNLTDPEIKQICLPDVLNILETTQWPYSGITVVAVGWGALYENGPTSEILQQVTLQTINFQAPTCDPIMNFPSTSFCAGVPNSTKDTCQGDSGGPVMMFSTTRQWIIVGITSFGIGCAQPGFAGVYTSVGVYQNWIKSYANDSIWLPDPTMSTTESTSTTTTTTIITTTISTIITTTISTIISTTITTTIPSIDLHGNIVGASIYNVFVFALLNFLLVVYF